MTETEGKKLALVTGAGRGIGRAIAEKYAELGCRVLCVSRSESSCGQAAEAIRHSGGDAVAYPVDVADGEAVEALCSRILEAEGTVDILVNNAGITRDGLLFRMSTADWESVIQTNLTSCFHFCKHLGRPMTRQRYGRIINITSVIGQMGNAGQANYAAAKAGMIGFTKSLAKEFAARQVTVNAIAPGFIETDMTAELGNVTRESITKMIPLKRLGSVADVAGIAGFLIGEDATYITGQVFTVDGGMVM